MAMNNTSMNALFGSKKNDIGTVTDGDDVSFPSGHTGLIRMAASAASTGHSKVRVPGAQVGDIIRIEAKSAVKFVADAIDSNIVENALAIKADITMAQYDRLYLKRERHPTTGVSYWALFLFADVTA